MSYKDCKGNVIKEGDLVATTVTMNHEGFLNSFELKTVCKGNAVGESECDARALYLNGITSYGRLADHDPLDMWVMQPGANLRNMFSYFATRQNQHERRTEKDAPTEKQCPTDQSMFNDLVEGLLSLEQHNSVVIRGAEKWANQIRTDPCDFIRHGNTIHEISRQLKVIKNKKQNQKFRDWKLSNLEKENEELKAQINNPKNSSEVKQ